MQPKISKREAVTRGALFVGAAMLTDLVPMLATGQPINWALALAKMALAACINMGAFMDQSRSRAKVDAEPSLPMPVSLVPGQSLPVHEVKPPGAFSTATPGVAAPIADEDPS